jgi:hypothetical protein
MKLTTAAQDAGWADRIRAHLRSCEEALLDPAVRRDRAQVAGLLAEDFVEFGSSGKVWSREATLDLLATEDFRRPAMEDFNCNWIAGGVVLVTYRTVRVDPQSGEGTEVLRSSIWIEERGEWRMRFHQGTKVPLLNGLTFRDG